MIRAIVLAALLSAIPTLTPQPAHAGWVVIGGVRFPDNASRYVIYYRFIPGVANPGSRPRVYYSYQEMRDAMRRANNNGWRVDFGRSYYVP